MIGSIVDDLLQRLKMRWFVIMVAPEMEDESRRRRRRRRVKGGKEWSDTIFFCWSLRFEV